MQKPSMGMVVYAVVDPRINNGEDVAPAIITRVRETEGEGEGNERVNLRVLLDTGADLRLTNVALSDERPDEDDDSVGKTVEGTQRVAYWPEEPAKS